VFAGFILLAAGFVILVASSLQGTSGSAGGFILIGPVPIVFGSGPSGTPLAALALVAGLVMLVLLAVFLRRATAGRRFGEENP